MKSHGLSYLLGRFRQNHPKDADEWIKEQLEYHHRAFTKNEEVTISICIFNVNNKKCEENFRDWLRVKKQPSFIVVGLQEIDMSPSALIHGETELRDVWDTILNHQINKDSTFRHDHMTYKKLGTKQMVGLYLTIFGKMHIVPTVSEIGSGSFPTGIMGTLGNKGAIGFSVKIYRSKILFLNAHLTPHLSEAHKRNNEFCSIIQNFNIDESSNAKQRRLLPYDHDIVFFFGDVNYRLHGFTYEEVLKLVSRNRWEELLRKDQLRAELSDVDSAWFGFQEAAPRFPPTYRYDAGTSKFDESEKPRIPAYTDRILWWTRSMNLNQNIDGEVYVVPSDVRSFAEIKSSDHKPVSAFFEVSLRKEIIEEKRKLTYELEKRISELGHSAILTPVVELSANRISFGKMRYGESRSKRIYVKNCGESAVRVEILMPKTLRDVKFLPSYVLGKRGKERQSSHWFTVTPLVHFSFPGKREAIEFKVDLEREGMSFLKHFHSLKDTSTSKLTERVAIKPLHGAPKYLDLEVVILPSCFGNSLSNLFTMDTKICTEKFKATKPLNPGGTLVPKALWHLIHFFSSQLPVEKEFFSTFDSLRKNKNLCRDVDESRFERISDYDFSQIFSTIALFFIELQEPLVPYAYYFLFFSSCLSYGEYIEQFYKLPTVNYNTMMYMFSFLRFLFRSQGCNPKKVPLELFATEFSRVFFRRPPKDSLHYRKLSQTERSRQNENRVKFFMLFLK